MKYPIFFIILFILIGCDDIGKDYYWLNDQTGFNRRYGSIGYDYGWNAAYSPFDEGFIVTGQVSPAIIGKSDLWAIKTDNNGLMQWEKRFGGDGDDVGFDVIATSDACFLLVGYSWSFGNEQQIYVIKVDFNGNVVWEKTFGGSMWDVGNSVIELSEGGYLIAGYSNSPLVSSGNTDMFLIKIDIHGEVIWQNAYGNQSFPNHEWAYDVLETTNKDLIVVGARDRYNNGGVNALIYRLDKNGKIVWEKEIMDDSQVSESIYSISETAAGNYYLCTGLNSINSPDIFQPKIIKMDGLGNIGWQKTLLSNGKEHHQFRATATSSGGIVVAGSSSKYSTSGYDEDAFMTKLDHLGNIIWTYPYGTADKDDWGWSIFETPRSNLVMVGSTKSFGSSLFDIFLMGTNSEGIFK